MADDNPFETKESCELTGLKENGNNCQLPPFHWGTVQKSAQKLHSSSDLKKKKKSSDLMNDSES